jgi:hypothetical protein
MSKGEEIGERSLCSLNMDGVNMTLGKGLGKDCSEVEPSERSELVTFLDPCLSSRRKERREEEYLFSVSLTWNFIRYVNPKLGWQVRRELPLKALVAVTA